MVRRVAWFDESEERNAEKRNKRVSQMWGMGMQILKRGKASGRVRGMRPRVENQIAFGDAPGAETVGERCNSRAAQRYRWNGGLGMSNTASVLTELNTLRASRFAVMLAKMFGQKA